MSLLFVALMVAAGRFVAMNAFSIPIGCSPAAKVSTRRAESFRPALWARALSGVRSRLLRVLARPFLQYLRPEGVAGEAGRQDVLVRRHG